MAHADNNTSGFVYCRQCGYDLRAQVRPYRCPECGRTFDPANRKTVLARPPSGVVRLCVGRAAYLLVSLTFLLSMGWGCLYWGWRNERCVRGIVGREPLGGQKLQEYLGPTAWVLNRVTYVGYPLEPVAGSDETPDTDTDLSFLGQLRWLEVLELWRVQDAGLVHLRELNGLRKLGLFDDRVTDAGLVHLRELKGLQELSLSCTGVTDAGLDHIEQLKGLRELNLWRTNVTAEGVRKLEKALPGTKIVWR